MASEVSHRHSATGETLYFTIRNVARQMWNTAGTPAFETLTVANWGDYDVAMSESPASSYFYAGTFPAISGNMVAGWYWVDVFKRAGGSPAISDVMQASFFGYWDGTTYKWWADDMQAISGDATAADTLELFAEALDQSTGQIDAGSLAAGAITNATFAADVGSTAYATNILALAVNKANARAIAEGTVAARTTDADFTLTSTDMSTNNDDYNNMWLVFTSGNNKFIPRLIQDYVGATKQVLFTGSGLKGTFPRLVQAGDAFQVLAGGQ